MRDEQATTRLVLITAIAPITWGTTYAVTTELLPPDRPLLAATLRALPAGIALVAVTGCRPPSGWWGRIAVLGTLNVGAFFALLFVAATRLPGGVAAMLGLLSPLVATAVGWLVLHQSLTAGQVAGALLVLVALRVGQGRLRPPAPVPPTPRAPRRRTCSHDQHHQLKETTMQTTDQSVLEAIQSALTAAV